MTPIHETFARRRFLSRGTALLAGGAVAVGAGGPAGARPLASALSDSATSGPGLYDAMDSGATGNGTTDDTAAVQAAIDASAASPGGGICLIPHGTFLISKALSAPAGCHLVIDGTIRLADGANQDMIFISGSNVLIEGTGTLEGNGANQSATIGGIVNVAGIANVVVRGLTVNGVHNWGVNLTACKNALLEDMVMSNNGSANEFAEGATNCWARNCTITGTNDFAFAFYGGVQDSGITDSISTGNGGPGIGILSDDGQPALCQNITIANNHSFANVNGAQGIVVITGPDITANHQGVSITGNDIHDNTGTGILVSAVDGCLISGNLCRGDQQEELFLSAYLLDGVKHTLNGVQVVGNSFLDPGSSSAPGVAIQVLNPASNSGPTGPDAGTYITDLSIAHNMLLASSGTMSYCLAGGPSDGAFIHGNVLRGWSVASTDLIAGKADKISDNTAPVVLPG